MGQKLSAVSEVGGACVSPPGMIRHICSTLYVHPHGGSGSPSDNTRLVVHGGYHDNVQFRFVQVQGHWGFIEHVPSGKFFHPQGGRKNPEKGTKLILHGGTHGGCLFTYNEDYNVIQHRGGLYIHPHGGSTTPDDNTNLVLDCDVHDGMRWFPVTVDDIPAEVYPTPEVKGRWVPVKTAKSGKMVITDGSKMGTPTKEKIISLNRDLENKMALQMQVSVGRKKIMCNTFRHDWMISSVALDRISTAVAANGEDWGEFVARTVQSSFDDAFVVCKETGSDVITWQWVWSVSQWGDGWDFKTNILTHTDNVSNTPSAKPIPTLLSL